MGESRGLGSLRFPARLHALVYFALKLGFLAALFSPEVLLLCPCSQVSPRFSPLSALLRVKERKS